MMSDITTIRSSLCPRDSYHKMVHPLLTRERHRLVTVEGQSYTLYYDVYFQADSIATIESALGDTLLMTYFG